MPGLLEKFTGIKKGPDKTVQSLIKHIQALEDNRNKNQEKYDQAVLKLTENIKNSHYMLYGDPDTPPDQKSRTSLAKALMKIIEKNDKIKNKNCLHLLLEFMKDFEFESKKKTADIICFIVKRSHKKDSTFTPYFRQNCKELLGYLVKYFESQDLTQPIGEIMKEMCKQPKIASILFATKLPSFLTSKENSKFKDNTNETKEDQNELPPPPDDIITYLFKFASDASLIISSDAFDCLNTLINNHKKNSHIYIKKNQPLFFKNINYLIMSDNYVTQSKFLKLLADILLDPDIEIQIRLNYLGKKNNLRNIMILLTNESKLISTEAFHIFKVFVANPKKNENIKIVLWKNRSKLTEKLKQKKVKGDNQFNKEIDLVIKHVQNLDEPEKVTLYRKQMIERKKSQKKLEEKKSKNQQTNETTEETQTNGKNQNINNNTTKTKSNNNGDDDVESGEDEPDQPTQDDGDYEDDPNDKYKPEDVSDDENEIEGTTSKNNNDKNSESNNDKNKNENTNEPKKSTE